MARHTLAIIGILAVVTWQSSHSLDPFRPLASDKRPIVVQAIAMEWRWLFVYPEYDIATLNYVQIPEDTPIQFQITADAPMNSLWIPALGGQIYAMAGMETRLHLKASDPGTYLGRSANLSGEGFSGMTFSTNVTSLVDFDTWLKFTRANRNTLDMNRYTELSEQSTDREPQTFGDVQDNMFAAIIDSYNVPPLSLQQYESGKVGH